VAGEFCYPVTITAIRADGQKAQKGISSQVKRTTKSVNKLVDQYNATTSGAAFPGKITFVQAVDASSNIYMPLNPALQVTLII
jgi:hypothetical protein